jgi:hypothetical protein
LLDGCELLLLLLLLHPLLLPGWRQKLRGGGGSCQGLPQRRRSLGYGLCCWDDVCR